MFKGGRFSMTKVMGFLSGLGTILNHEYDKDTFTSILYK